MDKPMDKTAKALESLVLDKLVAAPDNHAALKERLEPVVRELCEEMVPLMIERIVPQVLDQLDTYLAQQLREGSKFFS